MESRTEQRLPPEVLEAVAAGMPLCPNCNGRNVRTSQAMHPMDRVAALFGYAPFRCRVCQHRFYKRLTARPRPNSTPAAKD